MPRPKHPPRRQRSAEKAPVTAPKSSKAPQQTATEAGLSLWRSAMRWRRAIETEVSALGLTLAQWLVLDATLRLTKERGDATSQAKVAHDLEMDRVTVSQIMRLLERRGLVDRAPDLVGPAFRIWVTAPGERLLEQGRPLFEAASARGISLREEIYDARPRRAGSGAG